MSKIRSTQFAAAVLATGFLALALGAHADPETQWTEMKPSDSRVACERARLSAWFEQQREMTDGGSTSARDVATPRECASMRAAKAADEAAPGKQLATAGTEGAVRASRYQ